MKPDITRAFARIAACGLPNRYTSYTSVWGYRGAFLGGPLSDNRYLVTSSRRCVGVHTDGALARNTVVGAVGRLRVEL